MQSKASVISVISYISVISFIFLARIVAKNIGWEVNRPFMKIIAQQFLGGLGPLHPANRWAAAPRAPLLPKAMYTNLIGYTTRYLFINIDIEKRVT